MVYQWLLLIASLYGVSPSWSDTPGDCQAALSREQRQRVGQVVDLKFDADVLTGAANDLPRTVVMVSEETPHQALNSEMGQGLYVDFDRVAFRFNFGPARPRAFARAIESVHHLLRKGLLFFKFIPSSSAAGDPPQVIVDVPPAPENNPYLAPTGDSRFALHDHDMLPEFLRQALRWQAESGEDSVPNKLVNLAAHGSRAERVARRLIGVNVGLLGSLTILPYAFAPDYLVPAIATLGVAWSYQALGYVLAKTRLREGSFFPRLYPWLDPRPRFDGKSTFASLTRVFSDHETRAVVLIVPRADRARALAALRKFGFSPEVTSAPPPNDDRAHADQLGSALALPAEALSFLKTHLASRALISSLTKIIDTTNEARLIWLGRALVKNSALSDADRALAADSAYFRENPAALDDVSAASYLAVSRAFADSLDDYDMGVLAVMIKRRASPATKDPSEFGRLGRIRALLKLDEYRSALLSFLGEIQNRPELRTTLGLRTIPPDQLERLIERFNLDVPTTQDLKLLAEVFGAIERASAGNARRTLRSFIPTQVSLAALMFLMGTFGPDAPAPATPMQLHRTILNSARSMLDPILAERPRQNAREVNPGGPPAPLAEKDFFAPKQDLKVRRKVKGTPARAAVRPKIVIPRTLIKRSPDDLAPQVQELRERVSLLRISLRTNPFARERAKAYAKMVEACATQRDCDAATDEINSFYDGWVVKFYDPSRIAELILQASASAAHAESSDQIVATGRALEACRADVLRSGCAKVLRDAALIVDPLLARGRLTSSQRRIMTMVRSLSLLDAPARERLVRIMSAKVTSDLSSLRDKRKRLNRSLATFTKIDLQMISTIATSIVGKNPRVLVFDSKIGLRHQTNGTTMLFDIMDAYFTIVSGNGRRDRLYFRFRKVNGTLVPISSIPVSVKQTPNFVAETHFAY